MILPDINLLLYAHNQDSLLHKKSVIWWDDCLSNTKPVVLCAPVLFGFLRISTNGRIFRAPLTIEEASALTATWLHQPVVQFAETTRRDFQMALTLLDDAGAGGELTTDAEIAAISLRLGATIHTNDTDFARFPSVRWINPLAVKR
jgi:toxin-antitoxin system PIN domain toxin